MKKIVKGAAVSQVILDDVANLAVFDIPAGMKVDSIAVINKSGVAGNIKLGAFTAGKAGAYEVQRLSIAVGAEGSFEEQLLTISAGASAGGAVNIVLDGAAPVAVTLEATDTTGAAVAAKIAAATFPGWTAEADASSVLFRRTTAVENTTGTYTFTDTGTTGAAAAFTQVVAGADGSGTVSVQLDGAAAVETDLTAGDTPAQVATKIAAKTYTGWTALANGATVTFTRTTQLTSTGAYAFATVSGAANVDARLARITAGVTAVTAAVGEQLVASVALTTGANTGKGLAIVDAGSLYIDKAKVGVGISSAAVVKLSIGLRKIF